MKDYNTRLAPIYKFIDVDEFIYLIQNWYIQLVSTFATTIVTTPVVNDDVVYSLGPFSYSPEAFRIFWRQIILTMFAASQGAAQFITYSNDPLGFEPLRVGSNCYPPNVTGVQLPELIIENIRMLQTQILDVGSDTLITIPVLGIYRSVEAEPYNSFGIFYQRGDDNNILPYSDFLCTGSNPSGVYPRMIDCLGNNNVPLQVNTDILNQFIEDWNFRINTMKAASLKVGMLAGESNASLLHLTRYAKYNSQEISLSKLPPFQQRKFPKHLIEERVKVREPVKRTNSATTVPIEKELVFVPRGFNLYTQRTVAISSITPISESLKTICQYMVLPSLYLEEADQPPLQRQVRVQNLESYVWDWLTESGTGYASQSARLDTFAAICAPGIAANNIDELGNIVSEMNDTNKGGFGEGAVQILSGIVSLFA